MRSGKELIALICLACLTGKALAQEAAPPDRAALLAAKLAAIDALQREADQLRLELQQVPQLMFHVRYVEVDLGKAERLGIDISDLRTDANSPRPRLDDYLISADEASACRAKLDALCRQNAARVISDPTIVTVSGRPASFHEGGEIPVGKDADGKLIYKPFGTELELTARLIGSGRLHADLRFRQSTPREFPAPDGGAPLYAFSIREVPVEIEMNVGETFLLHSAENRTSNDRDPATGEERTDQERKELVLMITPELVEPIALRPAPGAPQWQSTLGGYGAPAIPPAPRQAPRPVERIVRPQPAAAPSPGQIQLDIRIAEIQINKLRALGHDVSDMSDALRLLGFADETAPVHVIEDESAIEQRIESLVEQGAVTFVSSPKITTTSGLEAGANYGFLCPMTGRQTGCSLRLRPQVTEDGKVMIEFTGRFTAPKPLPAGASLADAKHFVALREVQTSLLANPGQTLAVPGGMIEKEVRTQEGGIVKTSTELIVPLYFVTASLPAPGERSAGRAVRPK